MKKGESVRMYHAPIWNEPIIMEMRQQRGKGNHYSRS